MSQSPTPEIDDKLQHAPFKSNMDLKGALANWQLTAKAHTVLRMLYEPLSAP